MPDVEQGEGGIVVVELEPKHLTRMGIESTVLESPHEGHNPSKGVELPNIAESKGDSAHCQNNADIGEDCHLAAKLVDYRTNEEATEDFSQAKEDHGKRGPFILVRLIIVMIFDRSLNHQDEICREIGYAAPGPDCLWDYREESLVQ